MNEKKIKTTSGKYGSIIQQARESASQQTGKPENQLSGLPDQEPAKEMVNLSIKVDKRLRRHWVTEAKRNDTTLVAAITEALLARFGDPQD